MGPLDATEYLREIGFNLRNGLIVSDRFQFGRIGERHIIPAEDSSPPIELDSIKTFSSENRGHGDFTLNVITMDGQTIQLPRSEYSPPQRYEGFDFDDKGRPLMPRSISGLDRLWFKLIPDFNQICWKEVTDNRIWLDGAFFGRSGIEGLSDPLLTEFTCIIQDRLRDLGCVGREPNRDLVSQVLGKQAENNQRNRFLDMMRGELWDGQSRLGDVFTCVFGGRMIGLNDEESERVLREVSRCWFIGAVARQHKPVQLDILPIMVGLTGIRKSSAIKWLAGDESLHKEVLVLDDKRFVEENVGKLVLELAELDATKGQTNTFLKAFLSKSSDIVRLPYDRYATENVRRFVMIGSSNEYEMLTDPTGNRRYFPFEASPDRSTVGFGEGGFRSEEARHYIRQVWAEAYSRYLQGEGFELSEDIKALAARCQDSSVINNPNVDILCDYLKNNDRLGSEPVCKKDLVYILETEFNVSTPEAERATAIWWKMPHTDWSHPKPTHVSWRAHAWLPKDKCISQRCRVRINPKTGKGSSKHLGE